MQHLTLKETTLISAGCGCGGPGSLSPFPPTPSDLGWSMIGGGILFANAAFIASWFVGLRGEELMARVFLGGVFVGAVAGAIFSYANQAYEQKQQAQNTTV